jgi:hypothetical protein
MKVSGFTFIRNAIKYDYPVVESIQSILPICDDFYVAVGNSDDDTLELIQSIDPKVRITETVWDESLIKGGVVLARETDKAYKMVPEDGDWCLYLQADEVIHEKYLDTIREEMLRWKDNREVDGLLLNYLHFYGSYDYIATSHLWYRKEIRVIRNDPSIYSYRDAQGFRKGNNSKLRVKPINAWVYHYGWVKHPEIQMQKRRNFHSLYQESEHKYSLILDADEFDYGTIDALKKFTGAHPKVIQDRIEKVNWKFDYDLSLNKMNLKYKLKAWVEKYFGFIPGEYRNYKII